MQNIDLYEENSETMSIEKFVITYRPLVKKIAYYMKKRLPSFVELDDILQSGIVGLLEAKTHFKEDQGATFETFACHRIRGAIIDSLRKNSWIGRNTLKNMRRISEATRLIEQRTQLPATQEEIMSELGVSAEDYFIMMQEVNVGSILSLDEMQDDIANEHGDNDPDMVLQQADLKKQLQRVIETLPVRDQQLLSLYYIDEFTFKEIGEILGLTEARICQLHAKLLVGIRGRL